MQFVCTDLSKAFNKVDQVNLFISLTNCIEKRFLQNGLCMSYLSDRQQCISYNNIYSSQFQVTSGVPQGSHLRPLFFSLIYQLC